MPDIVPFMLLLFAVAALLRVDFFFTIVYFLFALYIFSRLWVQRATEQLRAKREFTAHAFPGDQVVVRLTVRNDGWVPVPWVDVHESLSVQLAAPPFHREVVSLGGRGEHIFTYTLNCRRRGYHPVGPLVLRTGDLLGIVPGQRMELEPDHIIVYPRVVPLHRLGLPTRSPHAALPAPFHLFEDPTRIMGVSDYQRGDSTRRIHWTATASVGRLLVKQYQPAIARETAICLNLDQDDYESRYRHTATELAIVVAASVANHIVVREGLSVGLMTEARDPLSDRRLSFFLPPRSERMHLMRLLEVLARVETTSQTSFPDLLRRHSVRLSWGATLLIITGRESEELYDTLAQLRRAGFAVALILAQPPRPSEELANRAAVLGVPVRRLWSEIDMEAWP
jgi:uncharacterized protein (DUF58 family)